MKKRDVALAGLGILVFWQIIAVIIDRSILPSPVVVIPVFFEELWHGNMLKHTLISFWRVLAGMLLAVALAAPAGLVLGQSKKLNRFFSPVIYLLYPIPKVVLVPIILLFFGIGDFPKIIIIFMILFFQILVL
ncbi:MAG TPA: ABC transporter permease, partial [Anaerolineales bacterium]|nr:ABC transporter permease [Anaerolineales bacterium]